MKEKMMYANPLVPDNEIWVSPSTFEEEKISRASKNKEQPDNCELPSQPGHLQQPQSEIYSLKVICDALEYVVENVDIENKVVDEIRKRSLLR
jgi:hypothetical protein